MSTYGSWDPVYGNYGPPRPRRLRRALKRVMAEVAALGRSPVDPSRGVAILAYHGTARSPGEFWWLDFRGQMQLLDDLGYRVVGLDRAVRIVTEGTLPERPTVAITFDDAWANNLDVAFPELARRGWPATVFVATSFVGSRPYMTWEEIGSCAAFGVTIGNHTHGHANLDALTPEGVVREVEECNRRIFDAVGARPLHFCYPNGRYSPAARDALAATGLEAACSGRVGFNPPGQDRYLLRRLTLEAGDGPRALRLRLAGGYDFQDLRQRRMDGDRR